MFLTLKNTVINLECLRYAYCHDRTTTLSGEEYTIQLFMFEKCQSVEIKFDTKKDRDSAFELLKSKVEVLSKLKYRY